MDRLNLWYDLRIKVRDGVMQSIYNYVLWDVISDVRESFLLQYGIAAALERELLDE